MQNRRNDITADYVRECLDYDPETGVFVWRERPREHFIDDRSWKSWNARFAGREAGTPSHGYIAIAINDRIYRAHRLAWLWMTGELPKHNIDHVSLDRADNRFTNLREATKSQNASNAPMRYNNTSGVKGVSWYRRGEKWKARITVGGKSKFLGYFDSRTEAAAEYERAARERFGDFARTHVDIKPSGYSREWFEETFANINLMIWSYAHKFQAMQGVRS